MQLHTRSSVVLGSDCQEKEDTAFELGQTVIYHSAVREREKTDWTPRWTWVALRRHFCGSVQTHHCDIELPHFLPFVDVK